VHEADHLALRICLRTDRCVEHVHEQDVDWAVDRRKREIRIDVRFHWRHLRCLGQFRCCWSSMLLKMADGLRRPVLGDAEIRLLQIVDGVAMRIRHPHIHDDDLAAGPQRRQVRTLREGSQRKRQADQNRNPSAHALPGLRARL
jgi:hypothetical protein